MQIHKSDIENDLIQAIEPLAQRLGFVLIDLDCVPVHHRAVRVFIETTSHESPTLDDCARVSESLGILVESRFSGAFDLEVSSPGLDRRLRTYQDFLRFRGMKARLRLLRPVEGRTNISGIIATVLDDSLEMRFDGIRLMVPISNIKKANLIWEEAQSAV